MPNIILNNEKMLVETASLTYDEICELVGRPGQMLSVTHRDRKGKRGGILSPGETVLLQEGHRICALNTGAA